MDEYVKNSGDKDYKIQMEDFSRPTQCIKGTQVGDFILRTLKVTVPKDHEVRPDARMTFQEFTTHPFVNDFHYIRKLLDDNRRQRLEFQHYKEDNDKKFALLFNEIE